MTSTSPRLELGLGPWVGRGTDLLGGAQDDGDSIAAIHRALDLGINWIDTAAVYGLGHSEEVVAKALDGMSDRPLSVHKMRAGLERGG